MPSILPQARRLLQNHIDLKYRTIQPQKPIEAAMFLQRSAVSAARRAAVSPIVKRSFTSSFVRSTSSLAP